MTTPPPGMDIVERLRKDVFYGDERAHRFGQHNPLHKDAADEIVKLRAAKDEAYYERNRLVALLANLYPSGIARTDIPGWDPEWHGCVYIDLPTGQASWHYHDREAHLFAHLPAYTKSWDGHTTEEKYARVTRLRRAAPEWQPISTAPKDGTHILGWPVWGGAHEVAEIYWQPMRRTPGRWAVPFGPPSPRGPTRWQPLPSPPASQAAAVAGEERNP